MTDLHKFLPLVLALSRRINSVEVIHDQMLYTVSDRSHLADEIEQVTVSKESPEGTSSSTLIVVSKDRERVALAIPVEIEEGTIRLLELPADTPRLFCDFPLIGTEAFQLPVIVNSPLFHPTEPRDGVVLTDAGHFKPEENKEIFKEVVRLYLRIVEYAAENCWKSLFVLAGLSEAPKREWLSQTWFNSVVLQPIREQLLITPIVETADGALKAMKTVAGNEEVYFPYDAKEEVREGIWRFANDWQESKLPRREHIDAWYDLLWSACPTLSVVKLIQSISATKSSAALAEMLNRSEKEAISWLSNLVEFLVNTDNEKYLDVFHEIIHYPSGKSFVKPKEQYPILPNQHGIFHVKQKLYLDDDINEQLKNIAEALGKDYRAELLHKDIALIDPGHKALTQQDVAKEIERRVRERISGNDQSEPTQLAFSQLLRWFDNNLALAQDLFGSLYEDQHLLQTAEEARDIRRQAARASDLESKNAELHVQREILVNEKEQLQAEIHQLREQLDRLQATDRTLPDAGDDERSTEARLHAQQLLEVWKAIKEALGQLGTEESRKAMRDLGTWLTERPELFRHLSEASREAYLNWLSKVMRAKGEVRAFLERQPDDRYDLTGWYDDSRFPTIVTGVKYYGRDVTLVIRPADGGFIVLYEELERAILERPDTELWIQGGRFEAQRFNIGKLVSFLNVNRLPLEVPIPRPAALYLN